ncbi:murein transglycosylase A [Novosphingobium piscinae]|uniref:peptidoglycan lytic exotransglycosylase n=1 Tax=Novosphingobium piscinae TaxID=1507448 RepID=A0A7X1FY38_9SPHN|nr:murein transglycosylase A [Novosphingobium piscinae]MBC2669140.1 murein transglycosylase A [Novosphingobium piscinae]
MPGGRVKRWAGLAAPLFLAACTVIPPATGPRPVPARPAPGAVPSPAPQTSPPVNAVALGVAPGPALTGLPLATARPGAALRAFIESCRALLVRTDQSGLTRPADWRPACTAAPTWPATDAAGFFASWFETARVSDGRSYVTGYYEPEIAGTRTAQPGFAVPVYRVPPDLVRAWPFETPFEQRVGQPPLGRFDADGRFVPYYDRAQIEDGALAGKGLEIGWAADPAELFFLQVQGSGRLIGPDGTVIRIGFAGQNGHPYTGIGAVLRDRGLIGTGPGQYPGSMQGILAYIREHPEEGRALMRLNRSYVFFREVTGDGPVGALNVPIRGQASLAADPLMVPLGAPVLLAEADRPEINGLWVAQDTGGAIKGANRFDSFWGAGPTARVIAGGMAARGAALILLPKGTLARLSALPATAPQQRRR